MKHLSGKKLEIISISGTKTIGVSTGGTDDLTKIMVEGEEDETVVFDKNIFTYKIIGEGTTGGYSGLKLYVCRCFEIGCAGRRRLSAKSLTIADMGCNVVKSVDRAFKCDFGCTGAIEVLPSKVQLALFDGMEVVAKTKKVVDNGKSGNVIGNGEDQKNVGRVASQKNVGRKGKDKD